MSLAFAVTMIDASPRAPKLQADYAKTEMKY